VLQNQRSLNWSASQSLFSKLLYLHWTIWEVIR